VFPGREEIVKADNIRVIETKHDLYHKDAINLLEECLEEIRGNPEMNTVIVCTEDSSGNFITRYSRCEDRARFGSRLILAGMKRMGFKIGG